MVIFEKNSEAVVIRVNDFRGHSFVEEHQHIIEQDGYVWMLKIGRKISGVSIQILDKYGQLIIKEPKKNGGKFYACHVLDVKQGRIDEMKHSPEYYTDLEAEGIELNGTWMKVDTLIQIGDSATDNIVLTKSKIKMIDICNCTRSPVLDVTVIKRLKGEDIMKEF